MNTTTSTIGKKYPLYPQIDHPWNNQFKLGKHRLLQLFAQDAGWELLESFLHACAKDPVKYDVYLHCISMYIATNQHAAFDKGVKPPQARITRMLQQAIELNRTHPQYQLIEHLLCYQGFHFPTNSRDLGLELDARSGDVLRNVFLKSLNDKTFMSRKGNGWVLKAEKHDKTHLRVHIRSILFHTVEWMYGEEVLQKLVQESSIREVLGTHDFKKSCLISHTRSVDHIQWDKNADILAMASPWLELFDSLAQSQAFNSSVALDASVFMDN